MGKSNEEPIAKPAYLAGYLFKFREGTMKTQKIFNLVMAVLFAFSMLGTPGSALAQEPNPIIWGVTAANNWISGNDWLANINVQVSIDDPSTPQNPDYVTTQNTDANGSFSFQVQYDIQVGFAVSATDGDTTKEIIVSNFRVTSIDWTTNTMAGIGTPNANAAICAPSITPCR